MFEDRAHAGRELAARLRSLRDPAPVVLALPRGGVPVAFEVAEALNAPLDLLLVRKVGAPGNRELAVAAVVDGDAPEIVENEDVMRLVGASRDYVRAEAARELAELERRRSTYLRGREPVELRGKTAIVIDDGVATGATLRAALRALRRRGPARVVLAVPVAAPEALALLAPLVDEVVCLAAPAYLGGVGAFYRDFRQTSDAEVCELLERARVREAAAPREAGGS
jgi:putative phosphoribosyl transferase